MADEKIYLDAGYILGLKVSVTGCKSYKQKDRRVDSNGGGGVKGDWKTDMKCLNIDEDRAVRKLRRTVLNNFLKVGFQGPFGFFFPANREKEMLDLLKKSKNMIADYNAKARFTSVSLWFGIYPIALNDLRTAHLIWQEAAEILKRLERAVNDADVGSIRKVIREARGIKVENGLPQNVGRKLKSFYKEAKALAVKLRHAAKGSETEVERVMGKVDMSKIQLLRAAFVETVNEIEGKISGGAGKSIPQGFSSTP